MSHKLLSVDGSIRDVDAQEFALLALVDASAPESALDQVASLASDQVVLLELPSSADGRAFSLLGSLTARKSVPVNVWLGGDLLPDQVSLAFQCGAQGVLVSETNWLARGERDWVASLQPPVSQLYRAEVWSQVGGIAKLRQA